MIARSLRALLSRLSAQCTLHAQRTAEAFYAGFGFMAHGQPFEEAGIPHIEMVRKLS